MSGKNSAVFSALVVLIALVLFCQNITAWASSSNGTINATFKYAWSEGIGWLNFGASGGNVHITASALTGYIWSENYGWINLSPSGSGVRNDGTGRLSGSAWGERTGYINFSGVGIDSEGNFGGTANGSTTGRIVFNCTHCRVVTDWRPAPASPSSGSGGGGGGSSRGGGSAGGAAPSAEVHPPTSAVTAPPTALSTTLNTLLAKAGEIIKSVIPFGITILKPSSPPVAVATPKVVPPVFLNLKKWNMLAQKPVSSFVFAPLPKELLRLTEKFPKLRKTFESLGISRKSDLPKLLPVQLPLPGLSASPRGRVPTEIVFARSRDGKIDLDVKLGLTDKGIIQKKFQAVAGSKVQFAVKPIGPVNSVKGYILLKNRNRSISFGTSGGGFTLREALASIIFQTPAFAKAVASEKVQIERRLAVAEFDYYGPDRYGIYTAEVSMPKVDGEYDIVTIISYKDVELGTREIGLIAAVDPEGYVYEKQGNKELRIPQATVSLFSLNSFTKKYELWPAGEYSQTNPQVTDVRGTYAFLVPSGSYYFSVEAPDYEPYVGTPFSIKTGKEVHINIELQPEKWFNKIGKGLRQIKE